MEDILDIAYDTYLMALEEPRSTKKLKILHGGLSQLLYGVDEAGNLSSIQQQAEPDLFEVSIDDEFEFVDGEWREWNGFFSKDIDITCSGYDIDGNPALLSYTQVKFPASNISQNYRNYIEGSFGDVMNLKRATQGASRMMLSEFWIMPVIAPYFSSGKMTKVDRIDPFMFMDAVADAYAAQSEGMPDYYSINFIELCGLNNGYKGADRQEIRDALECGFIEIAPYPVELPSGASPRLIVNEPAKWARCVTGNDFVNDFIASPDGVYEDGTGKFFCHECGWQGNVSGGLGFEFCPGCGTQWNR